MVLESWNLSFSDVKDPLAKVHYAVYSRMGLILKSIFCVTRSIPAYKIARRQTISDYKVLSSIYIGEGKGRLSSLGQGEKRLIILCDCKRKKTKRKREKKGNVGKENEMLSPSWCSSCDDSLWYSFRGKNLN